jgi:hypothetical protein
MARPLFAIDPGAGVLRWGWFLWVAWAVIGTGLLSEDLNAGRLAVAGVLAAPFWVVWVLWPIYRLWATWARRFHHSRWTLRQGEHYEFDGQPIRVVFDDDAIYFAAEDVFDALHLDGRLRDPERTRLLAGRDGLRELPDSNVLFFSEIGLRAWLERRQDDDALKFTRWVDRQVITPYRRRRELEGLA